MNASAEKRKIEVDIIKSTVNNPDFRRLLENAIDGAHSKVFAVGYPPYKSYPPTPYWHNIIWQAEGELRNMGFIIDPEGDNQLRLLSINGYECPVRLRFAQGKVEDGTAILSARKGPETKKGLVQNEQHFSSQKSLFPSWNLPKRIMPRELNLWVLYQPQPKFVTAWLALCTGSFSGKRFKCEAMALICSKPKGAIVNVPDVLPKIEDGGYSIDFGEKENFG